MVAVENIRGKKPHIDLRKQTLLFFPMFAASSCEQHWRGAVSMEGSDKPYKTGMQQDPRLPFIQAVP